MGLGAEWPTGGAGQPHMVAARLSFRCGVLWNLLVFVSLWISLIKSDILVHLDVFWINPVENTDSPKLVEFVSLNPYTYVW